MDSQPLLHNNTKKAPCSRQRCAWCAGICVLLTVAGVVICIVLRNTRECSSGYTRYQLRRKMFGLVVRDYAVLDPKDNVWATATGTFPRHFTLTSNTTHGTILAMDCSGLTSCLNLYPTYDITTPHGGPHGTLSEKLELIQTYTLALSTGLAYSVQLNPISSMISSSYTVTDKNGNTVAKIQKEVGGCSVHGNDPGLSACFKVCMAASAPASSTSMAVAIGIAVDQNH